VGRDSGKQIESRPIFGRSSKKLPFRSRRQAVDRRSGVSQRLRSPLSKAWSVALTARGAQRETVVATCGRCLCALPPKIGRDFNLLAGIAAHPGFLRRDRHSFFDACGIVSANFAPMRSFSGVMILPRAV